jgi:hypothetical protein
MKGNDISLARVKRDCVPVGAYVIAPTIRSTEYTIKVVPVTSTAFRQYVCNGMKWQKIRATNSRLSFSLERAPVKDFPLNETRVEPVYLFVHSHYTGNIDRICRPNNGMYENNSEQLEAFTLYLSRRENVNKKKAAAYWLEPSPLLQKGWLNLRPFLTA